VLTPDREISARAVVIAGGGQRAAVIPALAARLPLDLHQCDAASYRSPAGLPPGAVLVVGSGQSGAQIADELATAGREVLLATSRVARVPRRYRDRDIHEWSAELGLYDQATESVTDPGELREAHPMLSGARGGHTLALQQLARDGVRLLGRLVDAEDTKLTFSPDLPENMHYADRRAAGVRRAVDAYVARAGIMAAPPDTDPAERPLPAPPDAPLALDLRAERIGSVVWCIGFGPDSGWVDVPVLRADGFQRTAVASPRSPGCTWRVIRGCRRGARGSCTGWTPTHPGSPGTSPPWPRPGSGRARPTRRAGRGGRAGAAERAGGR
jgi:putative flavoprotein involved in K+ transport